MRGNQHHLGISEQLDLVGAIHGVCVVERVSDLVEDLLVEVYDVDPLTFLSSSL